LEREKEGGISTRSQQRIDRMSETPSSVPSDAKGLQEKLLRKSFVALAKTIREAGADAEWMFEDGEIEGVVDELFEGSDSSAGVGGTKLEARVAANKVHRAVAEGVMPDGADLITVRANRTYLRKFPKHRITVSRVEDGSLERGGAGQNNGMRRTIYPVARVCACGRAHSQNLLDTSESGLCLLGSVTLGGLGPEHGDALIRSFMKAAEEDWDGLVSRVASERKHGTSPPSNGQYASLTTNEWGSAEKWTGWLYDQLGGGGTVSFNGTNPNESMSLVEYRVLFRLAGIPAHEVFVHGDIRCRQVAFGPRETVPVNVHIYYGAEEQHYMGVGPALVPETIPEAIARLVADPDAALMKQEQDELIETVVRDALTNLNPKGEANAALSALLIGVAGGVEEALRKEVRASVLSLVPKPSPEFLTYANVYANHVRSLWAKAAETLDGQAVHCLQGGRDGYASSSTTAALLSCALASCGVQVRAEAPMAGRKAFEQAGLLPIAEELRKTWLRYQGRSLPEQIAFRPLLNSVVGPLGALIRTHPAQGLPLAWYQRTANCIADTLQHRDLSCWVGRGAVALLGAKALYASSRLLRAAFSRRGPSVDVILRRYQAFPWYSMSRYLIGSVWETQKDQLLYAWGCSVLLFGSALTWRICAEPGRWALRG
jgi:hypothetical protein